MVILASIAEGRLFGFVFFLFLFSQNDYSRHGIIILCSKYVPTLRAYLKWICIFSMHFVVF